jgi:acyl carrier protein
VPVDLCDVVAYGHSRVTEHVAPDSPTFIAPQPSALKGGAELAVAPLRGRHVYLRPLTPNDYPFLQTIESIGELGPRWRHRGVTLSPEQFVAALWADVLAQFMVVTVGSNAPVGRVVLYHPNFQDRYAYFAAMRFKPSERSPLMVYGIALFLRYTFMNWEFEKLYMEVPEYNFEQFASGLGRFFEIEGRLRGHLRTGTRAWDQLILAVYREAAIRYGDRLLLDVGERTAFDDRGAENGARSWQAVSWEDFVTDVAAIAEVPATQITAETRVLEDLALDSLALAELGVVLVDKYDTHSLSRELETRRWDNVTVRSLYEEYLTGAAAESRRR